MLGNPSNLNFDTLLEKEILSIKVAEVFGVGFISTIWGFLLSIFGNAIGLTTHSAASFLTSTALLFITGILTMLVHRKI